MKMPIRTVRENRAVMNLSSIQPVMCENGENILDEDKRRDLVFHDQSMVNLSDHVGLLQQPIV